MEDRLGNLGKWFGSTIVGVGSGTRLGAYGGEILG